MKVLGPGEQWGERSLSNDTQAKGTLTALDDTRVMVLQRSDFQNLSAAFPVLDEYFGSITEESYAPSLRKKVH